jgi:hypothetical protein
MPRCDAPPRRSAPNCAPKDFPSGVLAVLTAATAFCYLLIPVCSALVPVKRNRSGRAYLLATHPRVWLGLTPERSASVNLSSLGVRKLTVPVGGTPISGLSTGLLIYSPEQLALAITPDT